MYIYWKSQEIYIVPEIYQRFLYTFPEIYIHYIYMGTFIIVIYMGTFISMTAIVELRLHIEAIWKT